MIYNKVFLKPLNPFLLTFKKSIHHYCLPTGNQTNSTYEIRTQIRLQKYFYPIVKYDDERIRFRKQNKKVFCP